ncbi:MAG: glycosyltransferase family 2 protein [Eubacteriales bacterium]
MSNEVICGRYVRYPLSDEDKEGGTRLQSGLKSKDSKQPLITYITVVYNRIETLQACMESVWNQTYSNIEYIVVDGASTDGTLELIESNADKIDYYISQPDKGIYNAMNKGISLAHGDLICFMNSDDACTPNAAEDIAKKYIETQADIICGTRNFYEGGIQKDEITYPRYCIKNCVFRYIQMYHQATYASPKVFNRIGGFDEQYKLLADWIWESKAIDYKFDIVFMDTILTDFNYDGASAKGIHIKDDDWIRWILNKFPMLDVYDAETLLFGFDRERHPFCELKVLRKMIKKYQDDQLEKAIYDTVLLATLEGVVEALELEKRVELTLYKYLKKYDIVNLAGTESLSDLQNLLQNEIEASCQTEYIPNLDWERLQQIHDFIICILYHYKINRIVNESFQMFWKMGYCVKGRLYGKTVRGIHNFYPELRKRWNK